MSLGILRTENIPIKKLREFVEQDNPRAKLVEITLAVFALSLASGIVFLAPVIGNAVQLFKKYDRDDKYSNKKILRGISYLKTHKLIEYVADKDGKVVVRITKKGESKLRDFSLDQIKIKKQKKWDGKWRIVMFDFPVRFTKARTAFRFKLKNLGFVQFQKSVWIYPYPCEDEIIFIADFFQVLKYIEILEINSLLHETKLKNHFKL